MRTNGRTRFAAGAAILSLTAALVPAAASADPNDRAHATRERRLPRVIAVANDALQRALDRGRLTEGQYALERARSLFRLKKVRREFGDVVKPDPHSATLILRDLALRLRTLDGDDARAARAVLARPDDSSDPNFNSFGIQEYSDGKVTHCAPGQARGYCVHWAPPEDSEHAPPQIDDDTNGNPDFVDDTIATMDTVWDDIAALGFRSPKSDATSKNPGTDHPVTKGYTDIYLADIGDAGIYGYCTTDDPNTGFNANYPYFDFSAYCVLDNDYSKQQFPALDPLRNLQVTAAHEFFHAVQFAYDAAEDGWLMEGTAVAMEDIVYDDIDDNRQFLRQSQLVDPTIPLDFSHPSFSHPAFGLRYGAWLFWRFMTEQLAGGPPDRDDDVIRKVWERVDASANAQFNDEWSLLGAKRVSRRDYGVGFKKLFSEWGVALLLPSLRFEEGAGYEAFLQSVNEKGSAPLEKTFTLGKNKRGSGWFSRRLHHLTSRYFRFLPANNVGPNDLLKVKVDGPKKWRGTSATLVTIDGGDVTVRRFSLNRKGIGTRKVLFPDDAYLILQNASTRIAQCYQHQPFTSCAGLPKDDDLKFRAKGKLIEG